MYEIIGYLNYRDNINLNIFKKIIDKFFFRISLNKLEDNRFEILINTCSLNEKKLTKIKKIMNNNNIDIIAVSNKIALEQSDFDKENIKKFNGKVLMKNLIILILDYIYTCKNENMILDALYITINDDKNKDIIMDLATKFKCINIITDKIKKLKRLEKKLEKNENIIYSISNNTKKSLKKAKLIVNFDYDEKFFEKFNFNRNAIIINLSTTKWKMKSSFNGTIIENVMIDYNCEENKILNLKNFDKNILYESHIINMDYKEFKANYINNKCEITHLTGCNGYILDYELKKYNNA
ncbi:MAG: hypothetical protein J6K42_06625 [Clostridia bacterium]|nr:hypothetical protein [Clostridia bacterium]